MDQGDEGKETDIKRDSEGEASPSVDDQKDNPRPLQISEGTAVAAIPVLGYFSAFAYEAAYLSFFGLPAELVSISLDQVVRATLYIGAAMFTVYFYGEPLFLLWRMIRPKNNIGVKAMATTVVMSVNFVVLWFVGYRSGIFIVIFLISSVVCVIDWLIPFLHKTKEMSYDQAVGVAQEKDKGTPNLSSKVAAKFDGNTKIFFLVSLAVVGVAFFSGYKEARTEEFFLVSKMDSKYFIHIRHYGSLFYARDLDLRTKKCGPTVRIIAYEDSSAPRDYEIVRVGPLKEFNRKTDLPPKVVNVHHESPQDGPGWRFHLPGSRKRREVSDEQLPLPSAPR